MVLGNWTIDWPTIGAIILIFLGIIGICRYIRKANREQKEKEREIEDAEFFSE